MKRKTNPTAILGVGREYAELKIGGKTMAFLAGFLYYLVIFIVYCAGIFGAVKLGIALRKKSDAKTAAAVKTEA